MSEGRNEPMKTGLEVGYVRIQVVRRSYADVLP